ncbi:hypothetical protein PR202_ga29639 [Eleusine coracana subsp. coracana]|uniref:Protein FAR1-RELATED SEQUENCE n=1 Tax=Eleusine coracana subsp. coracana TaxID=191504 RepID=A0AAV5DMP4_ELECO|nr:hypothetical protein PR202_ga29639 [Eleusine coracana subsp. coracana]
MKDTFWAEMSSTQRSESVNALFEGYVNDRTTLKQFVEQYDNALRDKVEKENKPDCKSFQEVIPCITHYEFGRQFQETYTNVKFKEFQDQLRGKIYCYPTLLNKYNSVCTFRVREDQIIEEKTIISEYIVSFIEEECDVRCECQHFEFRGILCNHILSVLPLVDLNIVPSKYILERWRKDFKRKLLVCLSNFTSMFNT